MTSAVRGKALRNATRRRHTLRSLRTIAGLGDFALKWRKFKYLNLSANESNPSNRGRRQERAPIEASRRIPVAGVKRMARVFSFTRASELPGQLGRSPRSQCSPRSPLSFQFPFSGLQTQFMLHSPPSRAPPGQLQSPQNTSAPPPTGGDVLSTEEGLSSLQLEVSQPPRVWYKDQAHEPKFFRLQVRLVEGASQGLTEGTQVPLHARLEYADGGEVKRQDVLKLCCGCDPIVGVGQSAELKVRIDSVSKNHDNRDFRLVVSAAAEFDKQDVSITPCTTEPITVRSKRTRAKRKASSLGGGGGTTQQRSATGGGDVDPAVRQAIMSWCDFARNLVDELGIVHGLCPLCGGSCGEHTSDCKVQRCLQAHHAILPLLKPPPLLPFDDPISREITTPVMPRPKSGSTPTGPVLKRARFTTFCALAAKRRSRATVS